MSRKSIAFLLISCWIWNVMSVSSFEVVSVNRGDTDSFRVGKDGCKNDSKVCSTSATCREADGLCLCSSRTPTYRKFLMTSLIGVVYGCVQDSLIGLSSGNENDKCQFKTSGAIPYTQNSTMKFSYTCPNVELKNCSLKEAWSKTPNTTTKVRLEWMNESHVDLNVSNSNLYLKWKRSLPELQGTIIYLSLKCQNGSMEFNSSLGGKVLGTWLTVNPLPCFIDTRWHAGFDSPGLQKCNDSLFITGFYRNENNIRHGQQISLIEKAKCCSSVPAFSTQRAVCRVANWSTSLERNNTWSCCPEGYFLNGLDRSRAGTNMSALLKNIEHGHCCKPEEHPEQYRLCYDEDVSVSFNDKGWSSCSKTGYYITGLYRGYEEGLSGIEKFRCCQMTIEPKGIRPIQQPSSTTERPETTSSNEESLNTTTKIIIGLFCLAIVVIIGLAIVVGCLRKKLQSNKETHSEETGQPNVEERSEENDVEAYTTVVRRHHLGRVNEGASMNKNDRASDAYDLPTGSDRNFVSFKPLKNNNNDRLSGDYVVMHPDKANNAVPFDESLYKNNERLSEVYVEPEKKYTTLRRNSSDLLEEEENYQSLTTQQDEREIQV